MSHGSCRRGRASLLAGVAGLAVSILVMADEPVPSTPSVQPPAAPSAGAATAAPITQVELIERLDAKDPELFLLDVRSPQEFAKGHIAGAVNIPYDQVATHLAEVPKDRDVVLYCQSGRRAGLAAQVLAANGYVRLEHLEGDIKAWTEQGRPLQSSEDASTPR